MPKSKTKSKKPKSKSKKTKTPPLLEFAKDKLNLNVWSKIKEIFEAVAPFHSCARKRCFRAPPPKAGSSASGHTVGTFIRTQADRD
jgi:hypothetical protein